MAKPLTEIFEQIDKIEGWFNLGQCGVAYPILQQLPTKPVIVELGTYLGRSTAFFALSRPDALVLTIDICKQYDCKVKIPDGISPEALKAGNIVQIAGDSNEVVKRFNWPIDLLFIDSRHTYEDCKKDIEAWTPFVKPGGFVMFHDYIKDTPEYPGFPGVVKAVDEWMLDNTRFDPVTISYQLALVKRR